MALVILTATGCSSSSNGGEEKPEVKTEEPATIDPMQDLGIGPITSITLPPTIDADMAKEGHELFDLKCTACHKMSKRKIGPMMDGITERRTPEWIMNMILNPDEMVQKNALARSLLMEYSAPMANQSLTEAEARVLLEYFRENDKK